MGSKIRLTESELIKLIKRIINEGEKDPGKFEGYAIDAFKAKHFTRVDDTTYRLSWSDMTGSHFWKIVYKYFPEHKIGGFTAYKDGTEVYSGPADDCWVWFQDTFKQIK